MLDITQDIQSLSHFKRNTPDLVQQMRETGRPLVLTVNGKAELVVHDALSYQKLLALGDRLEAIEGVRAGLADVDAGRTRPFAEFDAEMRAKHDLPR